LPDSRRWDTDWEAWDPVIGVIDDKILMKAIPCSYMSLRNRKVKLGRGGVGRTKISDWTEIDQLLGKYPDQEIAWKYNVSVVTIIRRRLMLGIDNEKKEFKKFSDKLKGRIDLGEFEGFF